MASQPYEFTSSTTPYFTNDSLPPSSSYIDTSKPEHHGTTGLSDKPMHRNTTASGKSAYTVPYKLTMLERYTSDIYVVPVIVLGIHTLLLIFSWSFYASVMKQPKALNPTLAVIAHACPQSVTYITTMICSMINLTAITLYQRSIRYSISRFLSGRASLYALAASNRLAQMQIIDNFKRPAWTIAALLAILANMGQIAGYTTLLQPKRIEIKFDITGFELDLRSADFQTLMESNAQLFTPSLFERVLPLADSTGSTAVSTRFYLPSIFNFNQFSYFNSTKGILPIATQRVDSNIRSARGNTLPINTVVHQTQKTPAGFPVSFMMTQQGFTGDVKCEKRDLNSTTSPSVNVASIQDDLFGVPATLARLEVLCPGQTARKFSPSVLTSNNIDALFALSCGATENGRRRWDLILMGSGRYSIIGTTVCSIFPEIHTLDVEYSNDAKLLNATFPNVVNASEPWNRQDAPWLGDFAIDVFRRGLQVDQTTTGNAMGDAVMSFLTDLPDEPDVLNQVLAEYLRAVLEFSVTVLRTVYTQENNGLFPGGASVIPPSMRAITNGTYYASTLGWNVDQDAAVGILLAPTAISLAAIAIVVFTLLSRHKEGHGRQEHECNYHFDPTDILHVISAASAGGLNTPFPPFHEDHVAHAKGVVVTLKPVQGGRPGFINCDKNMSA